MTTTLSKPSDITPATIRHASFKQLRYTASLPKTSSEVLEQLSKHSDFRIRTVVAGNKNAKAKTRRRLAGDGRDEVVLALLANPEVTPRELQKVARHKFWYLRAKVVTHRKLPTKTVRKLSTGENEMVMVAARRELKRRSKIASGKRTGRRRAA